MEQKYEDFYYNREVYPIDEYWNRYLADSKYLYDLQKHTIIVSKILAKKHNDDLIRFIRI